MDYEINLRPQNTILRQVSYAETITILIVCIRSVK